MEFTAQYSEMMPERALTSFTVCDAYRYFADQAQLLMSQSRSRTSYLISTDNIDLYFNFTVYLIVININYLRNYI